MVTEVPADQRAYVNNIVLRLMLCRDPEGGYGRYVCPDCQKELRVSCSCKTRFCSSYGKIKVDNWVDDITKNILVVPHLHITLTTDDSFRPFFYIDRRLLKVLLRVGAQAAQEVVDGLLPSIRIGMVYTTHTFGRGLGFKPHVHLVIAKGGLIEGEWVDIDRVPGAKLSATWRYLLCKCLRELTPSDALLQRIIANTYQEHREFVINTESFYPKGIDPARYIGRYLGHPPFPRSMKASTFNFLSY